MKNLDSVILFLIDQTSKTAKRFSQREFDRRGLGITVDQWVLLKIIEENDGLSQNELAEKSKRDGASITRTLDLLEKKNLLQRQAISGNRRQYSIVLTPNGKEFIALNMPMVNEQRAISMAGFSDQEIEMLKSMLLRIKENMT